MADPTTLPTFAMPASYEPPLGTPLYWRYEVTGVLPAAVWAFHIHGAQPNIAPPPAPAQLALVIDYLRYVIQAPCWEDDEQGRLARLRADAATLSTVPQVNAWLMRCLEIGLDPL